METKYVNGHPYIKYNRETYNKETVFHRSTEYLNWINTRRTVRDFSDKPILKEVIENIILSASSAPSGAHKQPWTFCVVSNPELKLQIRKAAEKEEKESYQNRMNEKWLKAIEPLGTDWQKPFLEIAPSLIIVFKKAYDIGSDNTKENNYYVNESVGIACGFLLSAIHNAGLVALTHTPSPMGFLSEILNRPENERPFLLIPIGYPADETYVPKLERKPLKEISKFYE